MEKHSLHYAAGFSSKNIVALLTSVGATPNRSTRVGSAIDYAKKAGRDEIVEFLESIRTPYN